MYVVREGFFEGNDMQRNKKADDRQLRKIARSFGKHGLAQMKNLRRESEYDDLPFRPARTYKFTKFRAKGDTISRRQQTASQLRQICTGRRDRDDFWLTRDTRDVGAI